MLCVFGETAYWNAPKVRQQQRPEFDRLQGDIFAGKVKTVII
jgi:hypothetical protein